jgi:hypothetical protein
LPAVTDFGRGKKKTTLSSAGPVSETQEQSLIATCAASLTLLRHAGNFLEASINLPLPMLFFEPCGAGIP